MGWVKNRYLSSINYTYPWFWGSNYTKPGGFGLGQCSLPFVQVVVLTINYWLGVLGKQLHRDPRLWAGSKCATFRWLVVVTINYRLVVLGKKLTQAASFGMGLILLPSVRWLSTRCHHQLQAGGFLGTQLHRARMF